MATLGNTSTAASSFLLSEPIVPTCNIAGGRFTATEDLIATRIVAYLTVSRTHNIKGAIYEYDSGGNHVLVAETDVLSVSSGAASWKKLPFSTFVQLHDGVEYIIAIIASVGSGPASVNLMYTASSGNGISKAASYPTFPDPLSSATTNTHLFSIFVHGIAGLADGLHFGNETVEATASTLENTINGGIETMGGADGVANKIVAYIDVNAFGGTDSVSVKAALYSNAADPVLIAESDEVVFDPYNAHAGIGEEDGWYVFTLPTAPSVSASTAYTIAVWATSEASGNVSARLVMTGGSGMELDNETYGTWPDPMGNTNVPDWRMSVFVDYELPAAGGVLLVQLNGGMIDYRGGMRG